jgi:integrase
MGGKHHYKKIPGDTWKHDKYKLVIDKDKIKGLTPHVFRHNFATVLYYAGVDIKEAQRLCGHSNVQLTLDIYTHLDQKKSASAAKINKYLKNK